MNGGSSYGRKAISLVVIYVIVCLFLLLLFLN